MSSRINIIFDNYQGQCYVGSVISGKLECHFVKPKKFREITIKCEGKENTEWTETESYTDENNRSQTRYQTYTGSNEIYLNKICLVKLQNNEEVPAGKYIYPFSFLLPDNLPSSYDSEYGHISYRIKAVVDRPWKFNYVCEKIIIVESPIDLNTIPNVRNSVALSDEKDLCCFWCKSGPISISVTVPYCGFAPGDTISCSAYIKNLSNVNVKGIKLQLTEMVKYKVEFPSSKTKSSSDVIASTRFGRIGAHGEHNFSLELHIPESLRIPNFCNCALFKSIYTLGIEVIVPCPHTNLVDETIVTMGNIKLQFSSSNDVPQLPTPSAPTLEVITGDSASLIDNQQYPDSVAPPSYDQVMQGIADGSSMPVPSSPKK